MAGVAARSARRALLVLALLAAAGPAAAQDRPKKRPPLPDAPPTALAPAPLPAPASPPPPLRSAVRSQSSRPAAIGRSTTAQCRARCAEQRLACLAGPDDTAACGPNWTQCLSDCAGLGYGRARP